MEQNPNLRIKTTITAKRDEQQTLPDIIIFDESKYSDLVDNGSLLPLTLFSDTVNTTLKEQQALPLVSFMDLLFYNVDLLKAAGFNRPPKTRDEFFAFSRILTDSNNEKLANVSGTAMGLCPSDNLALSRDIFSWLWAGGGNFWSEDSDIPDINNRNMTAIIAFLGRLYREGILAQGSFETTGEQRMEQFARGEIGMMITSTSYIPMLKKQMGDNLGITMIPGSGTAEKYYIGLNNYYAGISSESVYPDEALKFLFFLTEQRQFLCEKLQAVPGMVSDVFAGDYIRNDPTNYKVWEIFMHSGTEIVQGFSGKPGGEEFENIFREEIKIFFEGNRTAEVTTTAIQRRWTELVNSNNEGHHIQSGN